MVRGHHGEEKMKRLAIILLAVLPLFAQTQRDYLSESEVEKVREAQDPNERLKLYVLFARQRLDQVQQQLSREKKGRSLEIRSLLDDYEKIIEAIDHVSDDALKRKADIVPGVNTVMEAERRFMTQLEKIKSSEPRDLDMYSVELTEAIATTKDSLYLAGEDLDGRTYRVTEAAEDKKKEVEAITTMERKATEPEKIANPNAPAAPAAGRRKPPTLIREGEKLEDSDPPSKARKPPPY